MRHTIVALAALAGLLAGPAVAGDTACLWQHVSMTKRQSLAAKAEAAPETALTTITFTDADLGASLLGCGITEAAKAEAAKAAFTGYVIDQVMGIWLNSHAKIDSDKLDQAWSVLSPERREMLQRLAQGGPGEPDQETYKSFAAAAGLGDRTDLMSTDTGQYLFMFMMGRALRAANEPKF